MCESTCSNFDVRAAAGLPGRVCNAMTDVSSLSVDDLGDYLIENDIPSDVVLLFCGKRAQVKYVSAQTDSRIPFVIVPRIAIYTCMLQVAVFSFHTGNVGA